MKHIYKLLIIMSSLFLIACNSNRLYNVTFLGFGGKILEVEIVTSESSASPPPAPQIEGHTFRGWSEDISSIKSDLTVEALYERNAYLIYFQIDLLIDPILKDYDSIISNLPQPKKEGSDFEGWYMDESLSKRVVDNMPATNITLYAKWSPKSYLISFETNCDEILEDQFLPYNERIEIDTLTRNNYLFEGWYLDEQFMQPFEMGAMPATDITLYAKWSPKTYLISFETNCDKILEDQFLPYNERIEIDTLTRNNYLFEGWYLDEQFMQPFEMGAMPATDITLYAKWKPQFIHSIGDQLYLGEDPFRFVSFNIPNLHVLEDPDWHIVDPWEQEDAIQSIHEMGGQVIRIYTMSIVGGIRPSEKNNELAHIMGIEQYNEELFRSLDKAIELANQYNVYLIIPFIDEWKWFGGVEEFANLYGKPKREFFSNTEVKEGFKHFLDFILNRVNTYTGVKYKDDPAILAWELGNELRSATDEWIDEMATYLKSIDSNHLLMSGRDEVTTHDLNSEKIDIISSHYYTNNGLGTFSERARIDRLNTQGVKPFIIGEYGLTTFQEIKDMVLESVDNGTSGSLIWSLRYRNVNGGFYYHSDGLTRSYHYPGFSINDDYNEKEIINLITDNAYDVRGLERQNPPIPLSPFLFEIKDGKLTWRGSTSSVDYIVERSIDLENWEILGTHIIDAFEGGPFYIDESGVNMMLYYYRIQAINPSGKSPYSNIQSWQYSRISLSNNDFSNNFYLLNNIIEVKRQVIIF